jgi:hypothetical protein
MLSARTAGCKPVLSTPDRHTSDQEQPLPIMAGPASTSPAQNVVVRGLDEYTGHCVICNAFGDDVAEDAAWQWVGDHRCGVETVRPPQHLGRRSA